MRIRYALDFLVIAATAALAGAWIADRQLGLSGSGAQLGLLGASLVLAGVGAGLVIRRQIRSRKAAQRYVDLLCRLDGADLSGNADSLPPLDRSNPWSDVVDRIRQCLLDYGRRLREAEHARARAEVRAHRMADQREQISEILDGLAEPVVAIDHYDELVLANPSAERLFDLGADEAGQRALGRLEQCERLVALLTEARRHKSPTSKTGEVEIEDETGGKRWYSVTVRSTSAGGEPADDDGNAPHGAMAVLRDVSAQKAIQRRNAEFVSAVSHEMKTPLAGIKAYVELLADGDAEDEQTREEFLDVINGQTDRLRRLIDNLLNLSRIEAGVVQVQKTPRSLNELLEEALSIVQPAAEQKNIELSSDLSPLYLDVLADRDMLLQAAINLLSNAVKYTPEGGRVTLRSRTTDEGVQFDVVDTGVGLSPEDCENIFQKFYRVKKDRSMASGTGLGLPLAKHIVEDVHGGRLAVESEPRKGSTFRITLPKMGKTN